MWPWLLLLILSHKDDKENKVYNVVFFVSFVSLREKKPLLHFD